jgi:hypothetical protein
MAAILGLIAAITAALITRSVMISNHRQEWINGLREDLAAFFAGIDLIQFSAATLSQDETASKPEEQKARNEALLAYRKILMRLNINETLHQQLEKSLESLLQGKTANQHELTATVTLARTVLKREWEVTKYGPFTEPIIKFKTWYRLKKAPYK